MHEPHEGLTGPRLCAKQCKAPAAACGPEYPAWNPRSTPIAQSAAPGLWHSAIRRYRWSVYGSNSCLAQELSATHEPNCELPLTRPRGHPLPSDGRGAGGEGNRERFMVPTHVRILEVVALHEPGIVLVLVLVLVLDSGLFGDDFCRRRAA